MFAKAWLNSNGTQGSKGLRQWSINSCTMIYNSNDATQNYPFCKLHLVFQTFEHFHSNSIKVPEVNKRTKKKTFGTSVINRPTCPLPL